MFSNLFYFYISVLLFRTGFFIDLKQPIVFEVVFFVTTSTILMIIITNSSLDGIFFTLGLCISSHFEILQNRILNMTKENLKEIVDYHNKIIQISENFVNFFAMTLMVNNFYVAIMIGFLGFQIAVVSVPFKFLWKNWWYFYCSRMILCPSCITPFTWFLFLFNF